MSETKKIDDRLKQIEFARKANGYSPTTIVRMQDEYCRAMAGNSRKLAIKTFCAECMGWEKPLASAIRECSDLGCPLYPYRPYRTAVDAPESGAKECTLSGVNRAREGHVLPCGGRNWLQVWRNAAIQGLLF